MHSGGDKEVEGLLPLEILQLALLEPSSFLKFPPWPQIWDLSLHTLDLCGLVQSRVTESSPFSVKGKTSQRLIASHGCREETYPGGPQFLVRAAAFSCPDAR